MGYDYGSETYAQAFAETARKRRDSGERAPLRFDCLIERLLPMLSTAAGPQIGISLDVEPGLPGIEADQRLELVLLNLVLNAREGMPDGGVLTIEASLARCCSPGQPASYLQLRVSDRAYGRHAKMMAHATECFFRTEAAGERKGIGLWLARKLLRELGGDLALFGEPETGTTVELWLPVNG